MASRLPGQSQHNRPPESQFPGISGAGMPGMITPNFHPTMGGTWTTQQPQMGGFVPGSMVSPIMPSHHPAQIAGGKDRNYLQQQQKLRAMASSFKKPGPLSADSLIEDLLQQKQTFSMNIPQVTATPVQQPQANCIQTPHADLPQSPSNTEVKLGYSAGHNVAPGTSPLPLWLSPEAFDLLPAVYRRVWELTKVPAADGRELVDTSRIFSILLTSGLPRDSLGYIWNLANTGIPGVLNRSELNVALALVALAQSGWRNFANTGVLAMTPQPPVPNLQLEVSLPVAASAQNVPTQPPPLLTNQPPIIAQSLTPQPFLATVTNQTQPPTVPLPTSFTGNLLPQQESISTMPKQTEPSKDGSQVKSSFDDNDDFTEFQSAPHLPESPSFFSPRDSPLGFNTFESPPISPAVKKSKGSREVGSRLANYSFGAPGRKSESDESTDAKLEDAFSKCNLKDDVFSKCSIKPPPQDNFSSSSATLMFVRDSMGLSSDKKPVTTSLSGEKKATVQAVIDKPPVLVKPPSKSADADKYSALRDLAFDDDIEKPTTSSDDFGDFLAGPSIEDDSFAELSKRDKPVQSAPALTVSNSEPVEWNANFDDFSSSNSDVSAWPMQNTPDLPTKEGTSWGDPGLTVFPSTESVSWGGDQNLTVLSATEANTLDDEDFGDFVGPSTTSSVPYLNRLKEGPAKTPDTQSIASLELGGFDSLSLGGTGQASSPEGGLSEVRNALESVQWEAATVALQEEGQEWRQCLQGCLALLQAAARILGAIEDPHVADEVVTSKEGEDYLLNLFEVYCVTQRISAASHQLLPASRKTLEPLLAEVEVAWQILSPFLERSSIEVCSDRKWNVSGDDSSSTCCALCLVLVEDSSEGNPGVIRSGEHSYHASCANLWVNCVSTSLPAISVP